MQTFGHNASSALAVPLPATSSSVQIAAFATVAADRSNMTQFCRLDAPDLLTESAVLSALQFGQAGFQPNRDYKCTSPQAFSLLAAGSYTFQTWAVDAGGNVEQPPQSHSFAVSYSAGALFAQVRGAVWGATNKRSHRLQLAAVRGTADGAGAAAESAGFQRAVAALKEGSWQEGNWESVNGAATLFQV